MHWGRSREVCVVTGPLCGFDAAREACDVLLFPSGRDPAGTPTGPGRDPGPQAARTYAAATRLTGTVLRPILCPLGAMPRASDRLPGEEVVVSGCSAPLRRRLTTPSAPLWAGVPSGSRPGPARVPPGSHPGPVRVPSGSPLGPVWVAPASYPCPVRVLGKPPQDARLAPNALVATRFSAGKHPCPPQRPHQLSRAKHAPTHQQRMVFILPPRTAKKVERLN